MQYAFHKNEEALEFLSIIIDTQKDYKLASFMFDEMNSRGYEFTITTATFFFRYITAKENIDVPFSFTLEKITEPDKIIFMFGNADVNMGTISFEDVDDLIQTQDWNYVGQEEYLYPLTVYLTKVKESKSENGLFDMEEEPEPDEKESNADPVEVIYKLTYLGVIFSLKLKSGKVWKKGKEYYLQTNWNLTLDEYFDRAKVSTEGMELLIRDISRSVSEIKK